MNDQEIDQQIAEGKSIVEKAEKLVAEQKALNERLGIGDDIFSEVLASDNFPKELKDKIRQERDKTIAEIEAKSSTSSQVQGKRSKISNREGVTRI